jgi:hypothetical protein
MIQKAPMITQMLFELTTVYDNNTHVPSLRTSTAEKVSTLAKESAAFHTEKELSHSRRGTFFVMAL